MSSSANSSDLDVLFYRHVDDVRSYLEIRCPSATVDDLISETFIVAWRRRADIHDGHERAFLIGVARNLLLNSRRADRRRSALLDSLVSARPVITVQFDEQRLLAEDAEAFQRAFAQLRPGEQELLVLVAFDALSTTEIAVVLRISPAQAANRIHKARRHLREHLLSDRSTQ